MSMITRFSSSPDLIGFFLVFFLIVFYIYSSPYDNGLLDNLDRLKYDYYFFLWLFFINLFGVVIYFHII
jgi:hypothetical protein